MVKTKTKSRQELTREDYIKLFDKNQVKLSTHFPAGHFLSKQENCENLIMLTTYYRRNLHRFAAEYLGLKLYWYQQILLYFMGICPLIVLIASRASAKSFIIGVYAVCKSILYPHSDIVLTSGTRGQAGLIVKKKILDELCSRSARLRAEISDSSTADNKTFVKFHNGSNIVVVTMGMRGPRATDIVAEEAREINIKIFDDTISPQKYVRPAPYLTDSFYSMEKSPEVYAKVLDQSTEIYISSSVDDTHWLYKRATDVAKHEASGINEVFFAMDYSIALQCGIKTVEELMRDRRKYDPVTWLVEYENAILRSNTKAYFDYDTVKSVQTVKKAFYPRKTDDVITKKPNPFSIPKQKDEVRIIAADIAFVDRSGNDNSCFGCLRLLPDTKDFGGTEQKTFAVQVPYLEAKRGYEIRKQAIRLRQLYADFDADYLVIDARNGGATLIDFLCKTLYDDDRCVEYPPIKVMNDEALNRACTSSAAPAVIYAISASAGLNSKIAVNFKSMLTEGMVQLLVPQDEGKDEICKFAPEYIKTDDPDVQLFYEAPYLQTMLLFSELINLEYEKNDLGVIRIRERPSMTKDRYTCVSYGCWFASELARDLLRDEEELTFDRASMCVSTINF